jgi:general secretion pathway protein D
VTRPRSRAVCAAASASLLALLAAAAAGQPAATAPTTSAAIPVPLDLREVRTTILPGTPPAKPLPTPTVQVLRNGDISLNFPNVDVQAVARAILGDTLRVPFTLDDSLHTPVTVTTPHPIQRADVIAVFEQALARANLVLVYRLGAYAILPAASAKSSAPTVGPADAGFGNETVTLKFVNAEEMRKLLDPLVPGAVAATDVTHNTLIISGNATQRKALRDLVAEFDVDWLKGMSFALFVPQRTDARLIAPELEKLLNGPGAPTAGLVRLLAMDSLNGILAITAQPQYLDDTRRFVEILDREGEGAERRVFIYRVQNGRAADLAKVINAAIGNASAGGGSSATDAPTLDDHTAPSVASAPLAPPGAGSGGGYGSPANGRSPGPSPALGPRGGADTDAGSGKDTLATIITADEANNAIVVFGTPRNYALISDALAKLDLPPMQVMIEANISEVTLNHTLQYGLQWAFQAGRLGGALSQGTPQTVTNATTGVTSTINPGPIQNFPGLSFLYSGNGVSATLNALSTVTDVTVLSAPRMMVLNNHTATIEVGDQVPISTGSAVSTIAAGAPIVNSIEYRDTGIILKVTPRVNSGGLVLLDIAQEVSDVLPNTTSSISSPTIEERKIATSVAVQDGETVALGGLIKNQTTKGRSTIPLLGNIPVLGHLFGDTTGGLVRTELVVLLTPHVVRAPVDARAVTKELTEKIHLAAPPPPPTAKEKANAPRY